MWVSADQQKQRNSFFPPVSCQLLCCLGKVSFPSLTSLGNKGWGTRAASTEKWEAQFQLLPVWWFWVCSCTATVLDGRQWTCSVISFSGFFPVCKRLMERCLGSLLKCLFFPLVPRERCIYFSFNLLIRLQNEDRVKKLTVSRPSFVLLMGDINSPSWVVGIL